jgi:Holliday junction resolvasome RuvABC endonuclease subunit
MIKRHPVPPAEDCIRILGVDTGLLNLGLCMVEGTSDDCRCLHLEVFHTKKADKKARRNLRVSTDDARRLDEIYDRLIALIAQFLPQGISVEAYTPNPKQRGVGAWKTAMVYSLVLGIGRSRQIAVFTNLPADIKKLYGGRLSSSKEAVAEKLVKRVSGFEAHFKRLGKTVQEHASDACAHGVLGLQEMATLRRMMGVR